MRHSRHLPHKVFRFETPLKSGAQAPAAHRRWMNVWCLAMLKEFLLFSKDHWFSQAYSSRKPFPRLRLSLYSSCVGTGPIWSHRATSFSKHAQAEIISGHAPFPKQKAFSGQAAELAAGALPPHLCSPSLQSFSKDFWGQRTCSISSW